MKGRPLCVVCLMFLCMNGIILLMMSGDDWLKVPADSIFAENETADVLVQGQVYKKSNTSKNQVLYLKNNSIIYQNQIYNESKIIIYDKTFSNIPIGTTLQISGTLGVFDEARNPGNFDTRNYYAKQSIFGFCNAKEVRVLIQGSEHDWREWIYQFRQMWKELLLNNMGESNGPILSAMLLAEKSEMDSEMKELYQKNGISHILAISGLHISFIGFGIYECLRRKLFLPYGISGIISVMILGMYVLMIGTTVSVIRAFTMLLLRVGAEMAGRVYDMPTALALSAAISVARNPFYLTDAGFYMSYGAIVGIIFVLPRIKKLCKIPRIFPRKCITVWEGCLSSIAINLTLFPVLLYFYFEISTYSVLINAFVIPMMSIVLSIGMFGSFFMVCLPVLGKLFLSICDGILWGFEWICELGSRLPFASLNFGKPEWWKILLYYGVLLWLLLRRKAWKKKVYVGGILIVSWLLFVKIPDGKLHITMVDVGQGDCIFIQGPCGKTYLVDGGSSDVNQVGKYRIEPCLKSQGIGRLDYVFVSHGDADHCNGIREMLERKNVGVQIKNLVLSVNYGKDEMLVELARFAKQQGVNVLCIDARQGVKEGELFIQCMQPENRELEGNPGSMVLSVTFKDFEMLLTGDIEGEGEEQLIKMLRGDTENLSGCYDVLKVSHHGSKNSTSEELLRLVSPKLALISAGEGNRYGHPHEETLERLKKAGCNITETGECGAIMLDVDGKIKLRRWISREH